MANASFPLQRIVITGASGFIGRSLVEYLKLHGHEVLALSRASATTYDTPWISVPGYKDVSQLTHLTRGYDVVIHLAALAHRSITGKARAAEAAFATNVASTRAMAMASAAAGVKRFIFVSSIGVNGQCSTAQPFTEDCAPQPSEPYAVSKLQCEIELRNVVDLNPSLEFVTIRPPLVYGPNAPGNFSRLFNAVKHRSPLPLGEFSNLRSFIGLENLMSFIELCALHADARNQVYLVSDGEDVSTADFIRRIGLALGTPARLLNISPALVCALARIAGRGSQIERLSVSLRVDSTKARQHLGWCPPLTLDDGLRHAANGVAFSRFNP